MHKSQRHFQDRRNAMAFKKKLEAHAMRKFHSIPVCPFHQMDQPLFNVVVPEARRGIKNVGHPVGIFGRWYRDLCECLCCCFSDVVFVRAKWIQG